MTQIGRSYFDRWDFMEVVRRPRALYAFNPCGLGTPLVESLSSYVTRLAEAHVVSVWRLILHVLKLPHGSRISRSTNRYAYPANGLGRISETFLRAFEFATQRSDLRLLTLTSLEGCIAQPGTFRATEAWCPLCLEQWRSAGALPYGPLLWTLQAVTMCPIHECPLCDRCPHCQSQFAPLRATALPGRCSICLGQLSARSTITAPPADQEYKLWAAIAIGHILAALPNLKHCSLAAALRENLHRCLNQTEGATRAYLAMSAGAAPCAFRGWITGEIKPTLGYLCRLCHNLKLPLLSLFQEIPPDWRGSLRYVAVYQNQRHRPGSQPCIEPNELCDTLARFLIEKLPPSVAEVARRLQFRRAQTLWSREPDLCRQIAARRRDAGIKTCSASQLYPRSDRARLERTVHCYLSETEPPSLNEIASRLGYKGSGSIRERFPEICKAITAKRKQLMWQKREQMRRGIEAARAEVPPPTLKQIGKRLGYSCEVVVTNTFPELSGAYKEWRQAWLDGQREKLRRAIQDSMTSEAAPTVNSVCRHSGISPAYFQLHFPEDNKELVRRSADRACRARADRVDALKDEVSQIVLELRKKGIYPSLARVRSELRPGSPRCFPILRAAINQALLSFAPIMRQRNELGRFV